jgi:outer membrane protein OmpA-like peptidoglycan-associated protein
LVMASFDDKQTKRPVSQSPRNSPLSGALLALAAILALALGVLLYLSYSGNRELQRDMAALQQRTEELARNAEAARVQATEAERSARQAANAREQAESARHEAETQTRQAQERADQAHQIAEVARKEKDQALADAERVRKERDEELGRLQEALGKIAETRRTAMGLVMNLDSSAIEFEFDKAGLAPKNRELLSRIAGILLTSKGYRITVYGHTDDVGSDAYNLELSERRAKSVCEYLIEVGIRPEIITMKGYGKTNPLIQGKTPEARAKNRRVEIGIVDTILDFSHRPR